MPIKLLFIRHFPTEWNQKGLYQGRRDMSLSKDAFTKLQNLKLSPQFTGWPLIASPLSRARQTARELTKIEPQTHEALVEVDYGEWEGQSIQSIRQHLKETPPRYGKWGWDDRPPGGESYRQVWARIEPFLNTLNRDTILMTHRGVIMTCLAKAWNWDLESKAPVKIDRDLSHLLEFDRDSGRLSLLKLNVISLSEK